MRPASLLLALSIPVLLFGCGDDGDATVTESTPATEAPASPGEGPQGELSETGIGSVEQGATTAEVADAFNSPDSERDLPGCELAGPNATPVLQWSWNLEDGAASIDFVAASGELASYRTTSGSLPTSAGVRVGDSFQTLSDSYGAVLKPLDLGAPSSEEAGFWYVGDPAGSWLLFTIAGGKISTIQGGDIEICE